MTQKDRITAERLRELLNYDPETGIWTRIAKPTPRANRSQPGDVVGCLDHGYLRIGIDGAHYYAHDLAWLYMTGEWPSQGIDHWDLDGTNNRFLNLRKATQSQNLANTRIQSNNTSGIKGVHEVRSAAKKRWLAFGKIHGKRINIGTFYTKAEAATARREWAEQTFKEFARHE